MLLRYQVFLTYGTVLLGIWYCCLINMNKRIDSVPTLDVLITFAPVVFLFILGIYLLIRLVIGVLAFEDCPAAAKEIDCLIAEAKSEMKRRNIIE